MFRYCSSRLGSSLEDLTARRPTVPPAPAVRLSDVSQITKWQNRRPEPSLSFYSRLATSKSNTKTRQLVERTQLIINETNVNVSSSARYSLLILNGDHPKIDQCPRTSFFRAALLTSKSQLITLTINNPISKIASVISDSQEFRWGNLRLKNSKQPSSAHRPLRLQLENTHSRILSFWLHTRIWRPVSFR